MNRLAKLGATRLLIATPRTWRKKKSLYLKKKIWEYPPIPYGNVWEEFFLLYLAEFPLSPNEPHHGVYSNRTIKHPLSLILHVLVYLASLLWNNVFSSGKLDAFIIFAGHVSANWCSFMNFCRKIFAILYLITRFVFMKHVLMVIGGSKQHVNLNGSVSIFDHKNEKYIENMN